MSPAVRHIDGHIPPGIVHHNGHNTTALQRLSKLQNLSLTMRKHQTNPSWRILQNNRPVLFKSVKVTKDKERLFQIRGDKGDLTTKCNAVP